MFSFASFAATMKAPFESMSWLLPPPVT
jgi:hypothetical protein